MVPISTKRPTSRTAVARCSVHFSNPTALSLIRANALKKGDVLGVARVAGIMAAKKTSELVPLCHPVLVTFVGVEVEAEECEGEKEGGGGFGSVEIEATVSCDGKTGVEMEALMAASTAALTVYDMCKAVDKGMRVMDLRVVRKEGGKSGSWVEGERIDEDGTGNGGG